MNNDEKLKYLTGVNGFIPKDTALLILNVATVDDLQTNEGLSKYIEILTKLFDSIFTEHLKIVEDIIEIKILNYKVSSSSPFDKKQEIFKDVHILKNDLVAWLIDNKQPIPTILSNSDNNNLSSSEKQQTEKPLSNRERDSLLKLIGLLAIALSDSNTGGKYGNKDKPNKSEIADLLFKYTPKEDAGIKTRSNRDRISKGLKLINQLKH